MKKAILLSLALVGSALSANVFMGPEYAKELCEVWNKTPRLTEELGKSESWTAVPERKIFLYREDCSPDKRIQLTIRNEGNKAVCVYGGPAKDKRTKDDFFDVCRNQKMGRDGEGGIWTHEGDDARKAQV